MKEKVRKEIARIGEQTAAGTEYGVSEHAYLHLTQQIQENRNYLESRMDNLENKVDNLKSWAQGSVIAILVGTGGIVITLAVLAVMYL